jgi:hypothetical protein
MIAEISCRPFPLPISPWDETRRPFRMILLLLLLAPTYDRRARESQATQACKKRPTDGSLIPENIWYTQTGNAMTPTPGQTKNKVLSAKLNASSGKKRTFRKLANLLSCCFPHLHFFEASYLLGHSIRNWTHASNWSILTS